MEKLTVSKIKNGVLKHAKPRGPTPHKEVLEKILNMVDEVNFHHEANSDKLKKKHYIVIAIEKILELAKKNNWGLCKRHGFVYLYNGTYWKQLDESQLESFLGEAANRMGVSKFDAHYYEFRKKLVKQFMSTAYLPTPEQPDDLVLINLMNGTVEINPANKEPVSIRPPKQSDFLTYQLPFSYDPEVQAPMFIQYLNEVLPNKEMQKILAEYIGYVFVRTATLKLEKALILFGTGGNGKSVFFDIIDALVGNENVSKFTLKSLTDSKGYHRAKLSNKLVNYASEIGKSMETSLFKQLVSGEPVEARLPYRDPFTLTNYAKLIFNCNELPTDVEHTNAYFRRFLIIPFKVTIPKSKRDRELAAKIIENELSGVFNWVLNGLNRVLEQKGFTECEEIEQQIKEFRRDSDSVQSFIGEREYTKSSNYTPLSELYTKYKCYCEQDGYHPVSKKKFSKRLRNSGVKVMRKSLGNVVFLRKMNK